MSSVLTPAGAALCAAIGIQCATPYDLFVKMFSGTVAEEHRYEYLIGCTDDQFRRIDICGRELECIVVGMFVVDGEPGHDRLCRKPRGKPTS